MATATYNVDINGNPIPPNIANGSEIISLEPDRVPGMYKLIYKTSDGVTRTTRNTDWPAAFDTAKKFFDEGKSSADSQEINLTLGQFGAQGSDAQEALQEAGITPPQPNIQTSTTQPGSTQPGNAAGNVNNTTNVPDATLPSIDSSLLEESEIFKQLPEDQRSVVLQVYQAIAENNVDQAQRIAAAFKTSAEISDPFFKQELRLAVDAIERGFISIDKEEEYALQQAQNRKKDLEQDIASSREFLTLEEQSALRSIEREYDQTIKSTRQNLASRGFSSSSQRADTEQLINETTGDIRESTKRQFGMKQNDLTKTAERGTRDIESEVERIQRLASENKLDFLRSGEAKVGTSNLPQLNTGVSPLGDIIGDIPQRQTSDIIQGAQNLIF